MGVPFALRSRPLIAGLAGVAGSALLLTEVDNTLAILIPVLALVLAGAAAHANHLGAQLFARAAWWSNLLLGLFIVLVGGGSELVEGAMLALGSGVALVVADRRSLLDATARGRYAPVAYKGTLQVVMVLALADMQSLLLWGALALDDREESLAGLLLGASAAMLLAFAGLYRLRLWGILVTMATSFGILVAMLGHFVKLDRDIVMGLTVLAALQLVAPLPMLGSMVLGKPLRGLSPRVSSLAATAVVSVIMVVASVAALLR